MTNLIVTSNLQILYLIKYTINLKIDLFKYQYFFLLYYINLKVMAYVSSYNNIPDFAAYLHNPFGFPNEKQNAAITVFLRKQRFVEGYNINDNLRELIRQFFGNSNELVKNGLTFHYNQLKTYVEENNLIGLILYGADVNNIPDTLQYISDYTTLSNSIIKLQISTICQILVKEYFKNDIEYIDSLCEKTPNFEIYYSK